MILKTPILFKVASLLVLVLLLITVIGSLFGYSSADMSLSALIDNFANTPEIANMTDISKLTNLLNTGLEKITIPDNATNIEGLKTFFSFINSLTSFMFGLFNLTLTLLQMVGILFSFIGYTFTTFFV